MDKRTADENEGKWVYVYNDPYMKDHDPDLFYGQLGKSHTDQNAIVDFGGGDERVYDLNDIFLSEKEVYRADIERYAVIIVKLEEQVAFMRGLFNATVIEYERILKKGENNERNNTEIKN